MLYNNPVSFSAFAHLVTEIRAVKARRKNAPASPKLPREQRLLTAWLETLRNDYTPLPAGTAVIFFRLLFPGEGVRRRYDLQEQTLCRRLESYFQTRAGAFDGWRRTTLDQRSTSSGCLGAEVQAWLERKGKVLPRRAGGLKFGDVDKLLDELASFSQWSASDVRIYDRKGKNKERTVDDVLKALLDPLTAPEIAIMIQIVLRDLSPLLYPLPTRSGNIPLREYNAMPYWEVDLRRAMTAWHPKMPYLYRLTANVDVVANEMERNGWEANVFNRRPIIGTPVQVPKSLRPSTCGLATKGLTGEVAIETKYDGERLQIHIDLTLPREQQIQIFSKSGRDSTSTRRLLLPIIGATLGLPFDFYDALSDPLLATRFRALSPSSTRSPHSKFMLEGEMVSWSEDDARIDEFWTLASVKYGGTPAERRIGAHSQDSVATGHTMSPGGLSSPRWRGKQQVKGMHLMVVFFDVLLVDDEALVWKPYSARRQRLTELVRPIDGYSMIAEAVVVNFDNRATALPDLRLHFARIIANRGEGVMLKPLSSSFNDNRSGQQWIKLKKDFIPDAGDTLDFVIVGASWQRDRGRTLNGKFPTCSAPMTQLTVLHAVPPSIFTSFFVGLLAPELGANIGQNHKKHYHIAFSTSYGLDRTQLDDLCHSIRDSAPEPFELGLGSTFKAWEQPRARTHFPVYESPLISFTFSLADHLKSPALRPTFILCSPRVVELTGAGFQHAHGSPFYELRWPRLTKTSREDGEPLSLADLQITAEAAMRVGGSEAVSTIAQIWQTSAAFDRTQEVEGWVRKLENADRVGRDERDLNRVLPSVDQEVAGEGRSPLTPLLNFKLRPTPTSTKSSPLPPPLPLRALKRRRSSLPPPSLPPLSLATSLAQALEPRPPSPLPSPLPAFFWSILPPPPGDLPTPPLRPLQLNHKTYLSDPLAVLWAAGHRPGYLGERREGVVFVRGEAGANWLRARCAEDLDEERKRVWVVKHDGFGEREREMLDQYLVDVL